MKYWKPLGRNALLFLITLTLFAHSAHAKVGGTSSGGGDIDSDGNIVDIYADPSHNTVADDKDQQIPLSPELAKQLYIANRAFLTLQADVSNNSLPAFAGVASGVQNPAVAQFFLDYVLSSQIRVHWVNQLPDDPDCRERSVGILMPDGSTRIQVACTIDLDTWVIKTNYDAMSAKNQALLWVHEGLQRFYPHSVAYLARGQGEMVPTKKTFEKDTHTIAILVRYVSIYMNLYEEQDASDVKTATANARVLSPDEVSVIQQAEDTISTTGINESASRELLADLDNSSHSMEATAEMESINREAHNFRIFANGGGTIDASSKLPNDLQLPAGAVFAIGSWTNVDSLTVSGPTLVTNESNISVSNLKLGAGSSILSMRVVMNEPASNLELGANASLSDVGGSIDSNVDLTLEDSASIEGFLSPISFEGPGDGFFSSLFGSQSKTHVVIKQGTKLNFEDKAICSSGNNSFRFSDAPVEISSMDDLKKYCK